MKRNDIFGVSDDTSVEKIAEEFPVLTDEEKERIFAMSEKKYNNESSTEDNFDPANQVSGVETVHRPKWYIAAYAAAAAVVLAAGTLGVVKLTSRMKDTAPDTLASESEEEEKTTETSKQSDNDNDKETKKTSENKTVTATAVSSVSAATTAAVTTTSVSDETVLDEASCAEITDELITSFDSFVDKYVNYGKIEVITQDTNNTLNYTYNNDPSGSKTYIVYNDSHYTYYDITSLVTDIDTLRSELYSFMTAESADELFGTVFGDDTTSYGNSYTFSSDSGIALGMFVTNGGKVFVNVINRPEYEFYNRTDEPVTIENITDDSFTAYVKYTSMDIPMCDTMRAEIINNGQNWVINDISYVEPVLDPLKSEIYEKMTNSCDYYSKISYSEIAYNNNGSPTCASEVVLDLDTVKRNWVANSASVNNLDALINDTEYIPDYTTIDDGAGVETYCDGKYDYSMYFGSDHYLCDSSKYTVVTREYSATTECTVRLNEFGEMDYRTIREMFGPNGQNEAVIYLYNFDNWDVTGSIEYNGRDCHRIEINIPEKTADGYYKGAVSGTMYVDKATGVPLKVYVTQNGEVEMYRFIYNVKFDDAAERVTDVDVSKYEFTDVTDAGTEVGY